MVVGLCAPTCDSSDSGLSGELVGRCGVVAFDDGAVVVLAAAAEEISRPAAEIGAAEFQRVSLLLNRLGTKAGAALEAVAHEAQNDSSEAQSSSQPTEAAERPVSPSMLRR